MPEGATSLEAILKVCHRMLVLRADAKVRVWVSVRVRVRFRVKVRF